MVSQVMRQDKMMYGGRSAVVDVSKDRQAWSIINITIASKMPFIFIINLLNEDHLQV
jgi:hypothetical protein